MKSKRKKTRLLKQFAPVPELKRSEKKPVTLARNDRWCVEKLKTLGMIIIIAVILSAWVILIGAGCAHQQKQPMAVEEETLIRYPSGSVERSRGIIARTQNDNYLVTGGYLRWAENLSIDLDAALAKLEQERISKLAPGGK